ncbi:MAG TPA: toast rack family protein [Gemmatimonadales bacterium]|nr:toast rack family protein [Gemmatimonadales bacterium]
MAFLLTALATGGTVHAQALTSYSTTRQFHGEVRLTATVEFGGGTLNVGAGEPGALYAMQLAYDAQRFQPVSQWSASRGTVTLGLADRDGGGISMNAGSRKQTADIQFSPEADLDLSLKMGAVQSAVDFGGLRLSSLVLETGASTVEVRFSKPNAVRCTAAVFRAGAAELNVTGLGNSRCDKVTYEGGVGSVLLDFTGAWAGNTELEATQAMGGLTLRIPRSVGVAITTEQFLATFQPAGFTRQGNHYTSANYATARRRLDVTLTTSLGGVTVEWVN